MNWFQKAARKVFGRGGQSLGSNWLFDAISAQSTSAAGITVTPESAMRTAAVFSCVRLLSETMAQLPIQAYRRRKSGTKEWLPNYPLQITLAREPNQWQTSFEWIEQSMGHLALYGNAYSLIVPGVRGAVTELIPLRPDRVSVERVSDGSLRYVYTSPDRGGVERFSQHEVFHVRGMSIDGVTGLSPVSVERDVIGGAKAAENYGYKFFGNSARPGGILTSPGVLSEGAAKTNREQWQSVHGGADNAFRTAVLQGGMTWQAVGMPNNDAQFIELRKFSVVEICRIFRIPPHLVYDLERATFSNIEEQNLEFAIYTILPWVRRWEGAFQRDLIVDPDVYVKFNMEGLMRGNAAARSDFYQKALFSGWMNINEVRELEDMDPVDGGDVYMVQKAMIPIDDVGKEESPQPAAIPAPVSPDESDPSQEEMAAVMVAALERNQSVYTNAIEKAHETTRLTVAAVQESVMAGLKANQELAAMQVKESAEQVDGLHKLHAEAVASLAKSETELSGLVSAHQQLLSESTATRIENEQLHSSVLVASALAADLIVEKVRRMVKIEVKQVSEAAKNSKTFLDNTDRFYQEHAAKFVDSLAVPMQLAEALTGRRVEFNRIVLDYIDESKRQLGSIYDTATADVFPGAVEETVVEWPDRAENELSILWNFEMEGGDGQSQGN